MAEAEDRVIPKHTRAGETHHGFHLLAASALVTVNGAVGTSGFFCTKPTAFEPEAGVVAQLPAFGAKGGAVHVSAVEVEHRFDGFPFPGQPRAGKRFGGRRGGDLDGRRSGFEDRVHADIMA